LSPTQNSITSGPYTLVAIHTFEQRYLTIKQFAVCGSEFEQWQVLTNNDLLTHTPSRCRLGNGSVGAKNRWAEIS